MPVNVNRLHSARATTEYYIFVKKKKKSEGHINPWRLGHGQVWPERESWGTTG